MSVSRFDWNEDGILVDTATGLAPTATDIAETDKAYDALMKAESAFEMVLRANTRPAELDAMPLGWERYEAAVAHEKAAEARLLELAKAKYPELEPATVWPMLWVEIPSLDESHATRYAEVKP